MALRWRELRASHPRMVAGIVGGIAVLLLTDLVLAYKSVQHGRESARMLSLHDGSRAPAGRGHCGLSG